MYNHDQWHTIEILNAFNIILMQGEGLNIFVHREHQGILNIGVIQAKSMSKLMSCDQEETVS